MLIAEAPYFEYNISLPQTYLHHMRCINNFLQWSPTSLTDHHLGVGTHNALSSRDTTITKLSKRNKRLSNSQVLLEIKILSSQIVILASYVFFHNNHLVFEQYVYND